MHFCQCYLTLSFSIDIMKKNNDDVQEAMVIAAAVILAGGKSRRMGRDKLALTLGGRTLLELSAERFAEEFKDVYISVADAAIYPEVTGSRIVDILPGAGPMSGLHAALTNLPDEGVFLVAADLPYADARAAKRLIDLCGEKEACIIRLPDGKLEPLFGYYKRTLLPLCEAAIKSGDYRMTELIMGADTRFIAPNELGALWNDRMILNINYPEDYNALRKNPLLY